MQCEPIMGRINDGCKQHNDRHLLLRDTQGGHIFVEVARKAYGVDVHKTAPRRTAYEQALDDKAHGRVNEYASADEIFTKLGI